MKKHTRNKRGIRIIVYTLVGIACFALIAYSLIIASAEVGPPGPTGQLSPSDIDNIKEGSCKFIYYDTTQAVRNQFKIGSTTYNIPYTTWLAKSAKQYPADAGTDILFFHLGDSTTIGPSTNYYVALSGPGALGYVGVDKIGPIYRVLPVYVTVDTQDSGRTRADYTSQFVGDDGKLHTYYIYFAHPQDDNVKGKYLNWIQGINRCNLVNATKGSTYQSYDVKQSSASGDVVVTTAIDELNSETNAFIRRWYYVGDTGWHDIDGAVYRNSQDKSQYIVVKGDGGDSGGHVVYDFNVQQKGKWVEVADTPITNFKVVGSGLWISISADLSFEKALADKTMTLDDLKSSKEMTFEVQLDNAQGPFVRKNLTNVNDNNTHVIGDFTGGSYTIPVLTESGLTDIYKDDRGASNPIFQEHKNTLVDKIIICAHKGKTTADTAPFINQLFELKTSEIKQDGDSSMNYIPKVGNPIKMDAEVTQTLKCGSAEDNTVAQNIGNGIAANIGNPIAEAIAKAFKALAFIVQRAIIWAAMWVIENMSRNIPI